MLAPGGSTSYLVRIHRTPDFHAAVTLRATSLPLNLQVPEVVAPDGVTLATVAVLAPAGPPVSGGTIELEARADDLVQRLALRVPAAPTGHRTVAVGAETAYAVMTDGGVVSWGVNRQGSLGNGTIDGSVTSHPPGPVTGLADVVEVAASKHALALTRQGVVFGWGYNLQQETGQATGLTVLTPRQVAGLPLVTAIAAADGRSWARDETGFLWEWGTGSATPTKLTALGPVLTLAPNGEALTAEGVLILESPVSTSPPHQLLACPDGVRLRRPLGFTRMGPLRHEVLEWDGSVSVMARDPVTKQLTCTPSRTAWVRWLSSGGEVTAEGRITCSAGPQNVAPFVLGTVPGVVSLAYTALDVALLVRDDGVLLAAGTNNAGLLDGLGGAVGPAPLGLNGVALP